MIKYDYGCYLMRCDKCGYEYRTAPIEATLGIGPWFNVPYYEREKAEKKFGLNSFRFIQPREEYNCELCSRCYSDLKEKLNTVIENFLGRN